MPKCQICSKQFKSMRITPVCSYVCALKFNEKKEVEKRVKDMKKYVKFIDLKAKAKAVFQKWVRKRDENLGCISCGTQSAKFDGGHYFKAELYSGLIFNEFNVNKQCSYCNSYLAGNLIEYRKGLIYKYGELAVEGLEQLANETKHKIWSREELMEIISKYK